MDSNCSALLLSGGASRRWGGRAKSSLPVRGQTALLYLVETAQECGCAPVVVVVGPGQEVEGAGRSDDMGLTVIRVPDDPVARTGSIHAGLSSIPSARHLLLWPVDHPFVRRETIVRLLDAVPRFPSAAWWVPEYRRQGGHPVIVRSDWIPRIRALSATAPLRDARPREPPLLQRVVVDDPGVVANIDDPVTYDRFLHEAAVRGEPW
jgi:CTP:molybdopterin cytidylyltransferase MocA